MTTATVTTDINIGPFKIPSNGQNMIMNNYASRNNLTVELVIPEPMMSNALATVQWLHEENKFKKIILTSIHQLPKEKKQLSIFIENMLDAELHFALEGIFGIGKDFLQKIAKEVKFFDEAKQINSLTTNWIELYELK